MLKDKLKFLFSAVLLITVTSTFLPLTASATYDRDRAISYLKSQTLDEWSVMALASSNALAGVNLDFLKTDPGDRPTDLEKRILAIVAAGNNPETFGQVNFVQKLGAKFSGTEIDPAAGLLNDDIFGLLAFAAANKNSTAQTALVNFLRQNQNNDGGWSYTYAPSTSDSNDTAMAVMALIATGESSTSGVMEKALTYLATTKTVTGYSFDATSGFGPDSASTSWVISALRASNRSIPDTAVSYLQNLQGQDGAFAWQAGNPGTALMTAYAVITLNNDFYPVRSHTLPPPSCNVSIVASQTTLLIGQTTSLEAVGFNSEVTWSVSNPAIINLVDTSGITAMNTARATGLAIGQAAVTARNAQCQASLTLNVISSNPTVPQFQVLILTPSATLFSGTLAFNQVTITDSSGTVHQFNQPVAIGTVTEAAKMQGFSYVIRNTSLGLFVECIASLCPFGDKGWLYAVNGVKPNIGAASYVLNNGDQIIWFFGGPNDPVPTSSTFSSQSITLSANIVSSPSNPPSVTLTASKTQINLGETVQLSWSSQNAGFVIRSTPNNWAGNLLSGTLTVQPSQTTTFTITVGSCPSNFTWSGHMDTTKNPALPICTQGSVTAAGVLASAQITISVNQSPSLVFGIDVGSVNFGDLRPGQTSVSRPVRLANTGASNLRITISLINTDSLYQQGLLLDGLSWSSYQTNLDANFAKTVNLTLQVPSNYTSTGSKSGTLIFWANPR